MTTNEYTMQLMNDEMTKRFNSMSYHEYEELCTGTGTLTVLDEVLSKYENIDFTYNEAAQLAEHCRNLSKQFGQKYEIYQISKQLTDAIQRAFGNVDDIGRLKYWVDEFTNLNEGDDNEHVNNYHQLILELAAMHKIDEYDLSDLKGDYFVWLQTTTDSIMDGFAEMCATDNDDDKYNDHDEWLQWLQGFDYLTWQEQQYINVLWDDEAKAKYKRN